MATVLQHITRALRQIGVVAEGEQPNAEQTADAIEALQDMLAAWEAEGVPLGVTGVALASGDTIPVPATHDEAIRSNLAMRLSAEYAAAVSPVLADRADVAFRTLQAQYLDGTPMAVEPALIRGGRYGRWNTFNG